MAHDVSDDHHTTHPTHNNTYLSLFSGVRSQHPDDHSFEAYRIREAKPSVFLVPTHPATFPPPPLPTLAFNQRKHLYYTWSLDHNISTTLDKHVAYFSLSCFNTTCPMTSFILLLSFFAHLISLLGLSFVYSWGRDEKKRRRGIRQEAGSFESVR